MKKILIYSTLFALAAVSTQAQGLINFSNGSTTKINTNTVVGGPAIAPTGPINPQYKYALFYSTTVSNVLGAVTNITGGVGTNYAFYDTNWTLVAYGSNAFTSGQFISGSASGNSTVAVPGVPGGSIARFVVIGWSANIGSTVAAVQSWFNGGNPAFKSWIGQSMPSGSITLGTTTAATLFGTSLPEIQGFTLGVAAPLSPVAPVITSQPADKTVTAGANVSFTVGVYGTPSPAYQWMFNGTSVIAGATNSTLTINNVQLTDAGTYSVVITNSAGSTNSTAATLTVNAPTTNGYVYFQNNSASITKIYTNSAVGGSATGLTVDGANLYYYALYASDTATNVLGQTSAILGSASTSYAFNDTNWTLIAYGTNVGRGQFMSANSSYPGGPTPTPGFNAGTAAQFVVIGWSANVAANNIANVMTWFNGGNPLANGWIGQSAVSGTIAAGNGQNIPVPPLFGTNAPCLEGFTLGLASPTPGAAYAVPPAPPAFVQTSINANSVQLYWPTTSGSWGVQSAPTPVGPWSDTGMTNATAGPNTVVIVPVVPGQNVYFRLVAE